jgi:hypothetical protein
MINLALCPGASCISQVTVGSSGLHGAILDGPIVDSTFQTVFTFAGNSSSGAGVMFQTNESLNLAPNITIAMGTSAFDIYDGTTDDAYFNNAIGGTTVSGNLFTCGSNGSSGSPSMYWAAFTKNTGNLSVANPPRLSTTPSKVNIPGNPGVGCSPMTEFANGGTDRLFFSQPSIPNNKCGAGTSDGCVFMYNITTPSAITTAPNAMLWQHGGTSGIVIDGLATSGQASSIYFVNQATATDLCWTGPASARVASYCALKLTQSGLQ